MLRKLGILGLLALFPSAVGAFWALGRFPAGAAWAAGYGLGLGGALVLLMRTRGSIRDLARAAAEREQALVAQREELQARVEFLSAVREISLVLNEDVDFRTVLDRVLAIACETLGGEVEVWMLEGGRLNLRAAGSRGEKTRFEFDRKEDPRVRQCLQAGQIIVEAEEGRFHALAPLQADREIIGVVRISTPLEDCARARQERAKGLVRQLEELSKFLALAVKTPDLYTRAVQDGLTSLWTKRHFLSQIGIEIESALRYGEPLSLIMVDVDHFKKVNDVHGHQAGDEVLRGVAGILKKRVRGGSAFRYGGEEMAILLPKADLSEASGVAERLRKAIESQKFGGIRVTASFGVSQLGGDSRDPGSLVEKSDQALYQAKEQGRNRVCTAAPPGPESRNLRRIPRSA